LYDHKKLETGRLVILKDITRRVESEELTRTANARLTEEIQEKEKLIQDLDAFSHTVAHDLKGMLGSIVSASNLIKTGIEDMSKKDLLEVVDLISQSANKTTQITRELLTLASVRQQEIVPVPVDMELVSKESLIRLKDLISEKKAQIVMPENWYKIMGYKAWIEEVLVNYISNALKYGGTPPLVKICIEIVDDDKVKFSVFDNGKGLSSEEMALLFKKFSRLDTLRAEGHGLGLSIVKRIVEKLGGEVGVKSKNILGEGCVFYFILPLAR
jgi:signal transduction histidine kinase